MGARPIAAMMITMMVTMAVADAHAYAGDIDMHLRDGGSSESECRSTGDTENQISHFFSSLVAVLKRFASVFGS
jgi:hypothetical protein